MKYSIILPVRNGGIYIKECVASILAQSVRDFNLLILDNCSTDGTTEWLSTLTDPRIELYPADSPLSIEESWARIKNVPKNEFMTIIGHDDVLDRNYLAVMDELIAKHPGASLYQCHFHYIGPDGSLIRKCKPMVAVQQPADVVRNFLEAKMDIMGSGFMTRSKDYDAVGGIKGYPNLLFADMELWIDLARKSYLAVDERECFGYRQHPAATTSTSRDSEILDAFDRFVQYLEQLKQSDPALSAAVAEGSMALLQQYCQGITHKVLRTPPAERKTPPVAAIINTFREYGRKLTGNTTYEPLDNFSIRLGKIIDGNGLLRKLFLWWKKRYRKPVLHSK